MTLRKSILVAVLTIPLSISSAAAAPEAELLSLGKFVGICGSMSDQHEMLEEMGRPDQAAVFFYQYWTATAKTSGFESMEDMFAQCLKMFPVYKEALDHYSTN